MASLARSIAETRLQTGREAIARSSRLLSEYHLHEVRGIISLASPRRGQPPRVQSV